MTVGDLLYAFGFEVDKASEKKVENSINGIKSKATKLLGAIGIGFSLMKLNAIAEEFGGINDRLRATTKEMGDQKEIQDQVLATANKMKGSYGDVAETMSNLIAQDRKFFDTTDKALELVELTGKAWKAAGKNESEIANLNSILNSSFALGTINAMNFQMLMKKSPETIGYMEKALGKSKDELLSMAKAGKLSADTLYTAFTGNADEINAAFGDMRFRVSDAFKYIRNRWGKFVADLDDTLKITHNISKAMMKGFDIIMRGLKKVQGWLEKVSKAVGGVDNMFKLMSISAGALLFAMNTTKILAFLGLVKNLLLAINLQMLATTAIIIALALIVDDFINFMQSNDSVIGDLFEKAGWDADAFREKASAVWKSIKEALPVILGGLGKVAAGILISISIIKKLETVIKTLGTVIGVVTKAVRLLSLAFAANPIGFVITVVMLLVAAFMYLWEKSEGFRNFVLNAWEKIKTAFGSVVDFFKNAIDSIIAFFQPLLDIIDKVVGFIGGGLQKFSEKVGNIAGKVSNFFSGGGGGEDMASLARAGTPSSGTAGTLRTSTSNRTITQNVSIANTFNGDKAGQRKSAGAMNSAADDTTAALGRGLAYAR